jgi:SAM-dependent methyltransferase
VEAQLFEEMYRHAPRHWWFRARRRVIFSLLNRYYDRSPGRVLDMGCGVGLHLDELQAYGEVWGGDASPVALEFARRNFSGKLDEFCVPDKVPYADASFDLVASLDVLEHIEDDLGAVQCVLRLLKPGGFFLLSVPALKMLWSQHDVDHHHFRRYRRRPLRKLLVGAGFEVVRLTYMNSLNLPAMAAARWLWPNGPGNGRNLAAGTTAPMKLFEYLYRSERFLLPYMSLPLGGSLLGICRKPYRLDMTT